MSNTTDRRDITAAERPWLAAIDTLPKLAELRRRVISAGYSAGTAGALVGWLVAKQHGDPDTTSPKSRSSYRRILEQLGGPSPPGRRRHRLDAQAA